MGKLPVAAAAAVVAAGFAATYRVGGAPPESQRPMVEKRLLYVEGGPDGAVVVRPGDVLQLQPFTYPVAPDFLGATLKVEAPDDWVVGVIGQIRTRSTGEGRTGQSVFLLARDPGKVDIRVTLVDEDQKAIDPKKYERTYTIQVRR
jgi:hypothetical protein